MNNDTNNNLNGTVLGSVNNNANLNSVPNNQVPNDNVETLDGGVSTSNTVMTGSQVMDNSQMMTSSNTFFNNPIHNENNQSATNEGLQSNNVVQPTSVVEPTPAYTNPQSINPAPMPGFENSGTIGTTPPISLEPEKKPKKQQNNTLFIILVLVVLAGVGFGTYYVLNYTDLLNSKEEVTVTTKNLELNVGDTLSTNIADYADITGTDNRNCSLDTTKVDISKEGTYEYVVSCGEIVKNGSVKVVDNTELIVEVQKVYKTKSDDLEAKEFILNANENLTYEFVDNVAVDNALNGEYGSHSLKIKAIAPSGKNIELDVEMVLIEHPIKGYIICTSKEQNVTDSNAVMTVSEKFAIVNDGNNGYGNIAYEIHTFKFSDETEYASHLATYKTGNKLTINNVSGNVNFDDENLTITLTNEKANETTISEYGANNLVNYSSIRSYFTTTMGYSCSYNIKK